MSERLNIPIWSSLKIVANGETNLFFDSLYMYLYCFSVDNSDYMRNGDFVPTRLQAQQDAVNLVCHSKTRSNPESNVGLIVMSR